ncbi:MAG: hypothetical protein CSA35_05970 [Dethiosulfovibrio peptidovorans]|nr:MAG: hypothetical protein CSA35_05970 [Dethiosulfovibrio peptidovorans]
MTWHLTLVPISISETVERDVLEKLSREYTYAVVALKSDRLLGICGHLSVDHLKQVGKEVPFWGPRTPGARAMVLRL